MQIFVISDVPFLQVSTDDEIREIATARERNEN